MSTPEEMRDERDALGRAVERFVRSRADPGPRPVPTVTDGEEREEEEAALTRVAEYWQSLEALRDDQAFAAMRVEARAALMPSTPVGRWRGWLPRAAAAAAAMLLAVGLGYWSFSRPTGSPVAAARQAASLANGVGPARRWRLADGSMLTLDADSAARVVLEKDARRITLLHGQAFFEVAKDRHRPFRVSVGDNSVVALGTRFAVRRRTDGMSVALEEGRLAVDMPALAPASAHVTLTPGLRLDLTGGRVRVHAIDMAVATGWRNSVLSFDNAPLAEVLAELNRYYPGKLMARTPAAARLRISGVFRTDSRREAVAAFVQMGLADDVSDGK